MKILLLLFLFLLVIVFPPIFADEETASLEITVLDINYDLANSWGLHVKIYQNNAENLYLEINPPSNPFVIDSLPLHHIYLIEVYRHGMFADFSKIKINDPMQQITMQIPTLAGIEFEVLYADHSPIPGALVEIFSHDGTKWGKAITDNRGKSERFWLQQTVKQEEGYYYTAKISLDDDFVYTIPKISIDQGLNNEVVVTSWDRIVDDQITIKLYKSNIAPVTKYDGNFVVELYDKDLIKVRSSNINPRGETYFSNLEMGNYYLNVLKIPEDTTKEPLRWALEKIPIGDDTFFKIFGFNDDSVDTQIKPPLLESPEETCNCVSFRLDNVQDYYLNNAQMEIIELFEKRNEALTLGVISKYFGSDDVLINFIKESISNNPQLEIGNQVSDAIITSQNSVEQSELIQSTNKMILDSLGVSPSVFIPPFGVYDDNTISILEQEGIHFVSSSASLDLPPYSFDGSILRFPSTTASNVIETGKAWYGKTSKQIILDIEFSIRDYGFAVVQLYPQEHSQRDGWNFDNNVDLKQLFELSILIDKIHEKGLSIVPIGKIPDEVILVSGGTVPDWVRNNAKWWSENKISDLEFKNSIEYMINKKIIIVVEPESEISIHNQEIPTWLKINAGYWSDDKISDKEFLDGLTFLIQQGIVIVS